MMNKLKDLLENDISKIQNDVDDQITNLLNDDTFKYEKINLSKTYIKELATVAYNISKENDFSTHNFFEIYSDLIKLSKDGNSPKKIIEIINHYKPKTLKITKGEYKLEPAYYHKDELNECFKQAILSDKMFTYDLKNYTNYDNLSNVHDSNWSDYEYVVLVNNHIIGYLSAENSFRINVSRSFSAILFNDNYKLEYGWAIVKFLKILYNDGINLINWRCIDHPKQQDTIKMYNRINDLIGTNTIYNIPEYYKKGRNYFDMKEYSITLHYMNGGLTPFEKKILKMK